MQRTIPLEPSHYYHIYNRGNNREDIFREEENYTYFLKLYARHIEPIAETFAYCLLKNHFHLLVRIKTSFDEVQTSRVAQTAKTREVLASDASKSFSNFFNAYAKGFNKTYNRTGRLFQERFGRIPVTSDRYFVALIRYIHRNPQKHGFIPDFRDWPYSSYHAHLSANTTQLKRDEVIGWFEGKEGFAKIHESHLDDKIVLPLVPDDFD